MRPDDDERPRRDRPASLREEDLGEDEADYADAKGVAHPGRRPDASMTLLTSMLERPLDPGYAAAAEKRLAAGQPASTGTRRPLLIVWLLIIGLVIGLVVTQPWSSGADDTAEATDEATTGIVMMVE